MTKENPSHPSHPSQLPSDPIPQSPGAALLSLPELEQGTDSNQSTGQARVGKVFCESPSIVRCCNTARTGSAKKTTCKTLCIVPSKAALGLDTRMLGNWAGSTRGHLHADYREEETCLSPWDRARLLTTHSSATPLTPGIAHYTSALCLELEEKNGYSMPTTATG